MSDFMFIWLEITLKAPREVWQFLSNNWEGIVATCALLFTFRQFKQQREHDRLSVKPFLDTFHAVETTLAGSEKCYYVDIINTGLGPAIVHHFKVFYQETLVADGDFLEIKKHFESLIQNDCVSPSPIVVSCVIPRGSFIQGGTMRVVSIRMGSNNNLSHEGNVVSILRQHKICVEYTSLYNESTYTHITPLWK
jgi:hypothetical protein